MDFKQLKHFIAVYETKSFTAAACRMNISQQGMSKSIRSLECELDVPLFERNRNHLQPTDFASILYPRALCMTEELEQTQALLENARKKSVPLQIGFAASVFSALNMDTCILEFQKKYPKVFIKISNETDYICEEKIMNGELDAAFSMGPFSSVDLICHYLAEEHIYALLPASHPLASMEILQVSDLSRESLIIADEKNKGNALFLEDFQNKESPPHISFRSNDPLVHFQLAKKGLGISLCPEHWLSMLTLADDLRAVPVSNLQSRKIYMICKDSGQKNPHLDAFIRFVLYNRQAQ